MKLMLVASLIMAFGLQGVHNQAQISQKHRYISKYQQMKALFPGA
jgi:hypothetical protein